MPQSLSSLLIHLVFSTKNRQRLITPQIEPELFRFLIGTFGGRKCPVLSIGGDADHIHILFSLHRTWAVADLIEDVKSSSSYWIKRKDGEFQRFQWQAGYGAFSIGQSAVNSVKRYIESQKEHHRKSTFQDEFRLLCAKHDVEIDERYVWK